MTAQVYPSHSGITQKPNRPFEKLATLTAQPFPTFSITPTAVANDCVAYVAVVGPVSPVEIGVHEEA